MYIVAGLNKVIELSACALGRANDCKVSPALHYIVPHFGRPLFGPTLGAGQRRSLTFWAQFRRLHRALRKPLSSIGLR